jgi:hypothetical protein
MNPEMEILNPIPSGLPRPGHYRVFSEPENNFDEQARRIRYLANAWLVSRERSRPNARSTSKIERRLHDAIKASPLHCKILSFAGMNLWVDDRTPDGLVKSQEFMSI